MHPASAKSGFTLLELAIVIVIVALIVAGVIMGRDMIQGAEIRAAITEIQKYQTAARTFQSKYGGIPGDLKSSDAIALGMEPRVSHGTGVNNNNGVIESSSDDTNNESTTVPGHEAMLFWRDLSFANLVNGEFKTATDQVVPALAGGETAKDQVNKYLPKLSGLSVSWVTIYSSLGTNYFQVAEINQINSGAYVMDYGITAQTSNNMDQKMDDSLPISGIVRGARSTSTLATECDVTANGGDGDECCGDGAGGSSNVYKMLDANGNPTNDKACQLTIRF